MNQQTYAEITKMLNAFPQSTGNVKALLLTYDEALTGVSELAIQETAKRFVAGSIPEQNKTFCPSIAEFREAALRQIDIIIARSRPRLTAPKTEQRWEPQPKEHRVRMGFKMSMLSMGLSRREVEKVAAANEAGLDELMALAQTWGVPIPEELWRGKAA